MNPASFLFFAFGALAASAVPVVFDKPLLEGKDERFATVLHGKHTVTEVGKGTNFRFLFLVPKLGAKFVDGFKSGLTPKPLEFLKVDDGEHVLNMLGFSDCKTWFAVHVSLFGAGVVQHKFFHGLKGEKPVPVLDDAFVDFLHTKMPVEAFKGLWDFLPSHVVVHKLHGLFWRLL